jgi:hypothetical protein
MKHGVWGRMEELPLLLPKPYLLLTTFLLAINLSSILISPAGRIVIQLN